MSGERTARQQRFVRRSAVHNRDGTSQCGVCVVRRGVVVGPDPMCETRRGCEADGPVGWAIALPSASPDCAVRALNMGS